MHISTVQTGILQASKVDYVIVRVIANCINKLVKGTSKPKHIPKGFLRPVPLIKEAIRVDICQELVFFAPEKFLSVFSRFNHFSRIPWNPGLLNNRMCILHQFSYVQESVKDPYYKSDGFLGLPSPCCTAKKVLDLWPLNVAKLYLKDFFCVNSI